MQRSPTVAHALSSLVAACVIASPTRATEFRPVGGEGGDSYRQICADGSFLVGFSGRTGDWIDRLHIVCARWSDAGVGHPQVAPHPIGDSPGGRPNNTYCPGGAVVTSLQPAFTRKRGDYTGFLDMLQAQCVDVATRQVGQGPAYTLQLNTLGAAGFRDHQDYWQYCPAGEFAVGLHGRAGLFIDSIGLVCGASPAAGIAMGRAKNSAISAIGRNANGTSTGSETRIGSSQNPQHAPLPEPSVAVSTEVTRASSSLPAPPMAEPPPVQQPPTPPMQPLGRAPLGHDMQPTQPPEPRRPRQPRPSGDL